MDYTWLLVSIWGDPGSWSLVKYRVPDISGMKSCKLSSISLDEGNVCEYRSTLGALMDKYSRYVSEAIVYLADTLALSPHVFMYKNSVDKCRVLNSYQDILECVEQYINDVLDDEEYVDKKHRGRIKTHVLPSIGVYRRRKKDLGDGLEAQYIGSPLNYYYGLLIHLYEYLTSTSRNGKGVDTVLLDISHGVNFMPVLGFRAVMEALKLYLTSSGRDRVRLIVLNSDPVVPGVLENIPRNINIVYCREFTREEVLAEIMQHLRELDISGGDKPYIMLKREKPPYIARRLSGIDNSIRENVLKPAEIVLKSIDRGLPLPLVYTIEELKRVKPSEIYQELIEILGKLLMERTVGVENGRVIVEHSVALSDLIESYLEVLAILNTLTNYIEEIKPIDETPSYASGEKVRMYSLDDLQELSEKYMVSRVAKELVGNEVSNIRDRTRLYEGLCHGIRKLIPYKCIYDFTEREVDGVKLIQYYRKYCERDIECVRRRVEGRISCPRMEECLREASNVIGDVRNFYAHAGFYGSATLVVVRNGKVYTGYVPGTNYRDVVLRG